MGNDLFGCEPAVTLQHGLRGGVDGRDAGLVPGWFGGSGGVGSGHDDG